MNLIKNAILTIVLFTCQSSLFAQCADQSNIYTFNYNGHSYEIVKQSETWTDAVACAVSRGGYLVEINNVSEQDTIFNTLSNNASIVNFNTQNQFGTASVWIGGSDAGIEGDWIWDGNNDGVGAQFWSGTSGGSPVGGLYTNWGFNPPEPDNAAGGQDHLTMIIQPSAPNFGLWNDLVSINPLYYVIEYGGILSVKDLDSKTSLNVYPNPFTDFITIKNNTAENISNVSIFSVLGQNVLTATSSSILNGNIDVSYLDKGLYTLVVKFSNGETASYKILK